MPMRNGQIEVARISSRQAIIVAAITAAAGMGTGYFAAAKGDGPSATQTRLENERTEARNDLANLKQRVRDILGPKEDAITNMRRSLAQIQGDPKTSQNLREQLDQIARQLKSIDDKVLTIVEK